MQEATNTRSALLWEVKRLLLETNELPQILLMENVPLVHSTKNIKDFNKWLDFLESLGYKNYFKDLNAKDYGIPQNRNRCFMISLLGDYLYEFPKKEELQLKLGDLIEKDCDLIDKKHFCSYKIIKCFCTNPKSGFQRREMFINNIFKSREVANTLTTKHGQSPIDNFVLYNKQTKKFLEIRKKTKNYIEFIEEGKIDQDCRICISDISPTLTTKNSVKLITDNFLIRRLTPIESFRFMGFSNEDYEKASKVVSETQLYKQCGNSIVVNVLEKIFAELF